MMDWRSRSTRKLLGKVVTVQVDRPVGYLHGDILYPINYGSVPGLMGGDGEEQDAYILGVDTPLSDFTGRVIAVIRRHNDCEDKLVVAPEGLSFHQGRSPRPSIFRSSILSAPLIPSFRNPAGSSPSGGPAWNRNFCFCSSGVPERGASPRDTWRPGKQRSEPPSGSFSRRPDSGRGLFPVPEPPRNTASAPLPESRSFSFWAKSTANQSFRPKRSDPAAG